MAFNIFLQLFNVFQANSPPNTTLGVEPYMLTTSSYEPAVPSFLRYPNTGREPPSTVVDCRGIFGCFPTDSPPWESPERPISLPPGHLPELGSFFCFYSARNPKCQKLNVEDYDGLSNLDISLSSYLVVITHGFLHSVDMPWVTSMVAALLVKYDDDLRVISLDWRKGSRPPYAQAVANIRLLGVVTGSMLNFLMENRGLKPANIHLVGHSLGAHLMGYAGSYLKVISNGIKVGRITGMDPAGPYFIGTPPEVHLDASDAFLVDIIHTDSTEIIPTVPVSLGLPDSSGHFDFYPNGGGEQNGCKGSSKKDVIGLIEYVSCSHDRAHLYFATTIAGNCTYIGVECTSWQEFKSGECWDCNLHRCFQMGFEIRQIFPNDLSRNISNQLEKNISNFVLSEETKISIYLATTNSEHLCGEQLRFTIRMSTSDIAKNAGGEYGKFSLILRGEKEFAEIIPFKGSIQYIEPGINITWVEAVGEIGEIHSIVFRFQEEGGLFQRFFRPLATPSVYIQELTIERLTQNERFLFKFCNEIVATGEQIILKPDDDCNENNET